MTTEPHEHDPVTIHAVQTYEERVDRTNEWVGAYLYAKWTGGPALEGYQYQAIVRPGDYCNADARELQRQNDRDALAALLDRLNRKYVPLDRGAP